MRETRNGAPEDAPGSTIEGARDLEVVRCAACASGFPGELREAQRARDAHEARCLWRRAYHEARRERWLEPRQRRPAELGSLLEQAREARLVLADVQGRADEAELRRAEAITRAMGGTWARWMAQPTVPRFALLTLRAAEERLRRMGS